MTHSSPKLRPKLAILLTVSWFILTACGQKGALYLPQKSQTPVVSPTDRPNDDSNQPAISNNTQNPNVTQDNNPTNKIQKGSTNDY